MPSDPSSVPGRLDLEVPEGPDELQGLLHRLQQDDQGREQGYEEGNDWGGHE